MKRRQFLKLVGAATLAAPSVRVMAQTPLTFKLGTVDVPTSHQGVAAEVFAKEVQTLSNGAMKVEVFHAGKLGSIDEQIKNVCVGAQDIHLLLPEFLSNTIEECKIVAAPYVFKDPEQLGRYHKGPLFKPAVDKIAALGAVLLDADWSWMVRDPRGLIAIRPITTPAELAGLKLRIWELKTAIDTWRGLGANTIIVPRPQMYIAFKQGLIEGGPETIGVSYDAKNTELAKFWTKTEEYHQIINPMMTKTRFDALSAAQKDVLKGAIVAGGKALVAESTRGFTEKRAKAEKENGVQVLEPDLAPWRAKAVEIVKQMEKDGTIPAGVAAKVHDI